MGAPTVEPTAVPAELTATRSDAGRSAADRPAPAVAPLVGTALTRATGLDAATFADRHWGRTPLLARAVDPDAFADLLDLRAVDELLSRRALRTPFIRLARNGAVVDSASFTGPAGVGAEIGDQVRDDRVAALFGDGATVVLQALHRTWPAVTDFATALGTELGHPVQANAYITPPSSTGFSAHYDVHDVFVLQTSGRKHWTVHAPVHPDPLRNQPWNDHSAAVGARARDDEPALDVVLEPGDALYLPRGWLHAATALGEVCAHLTVGVHVITRYALVEALTALVADDPRLRASLPLGIDVADPQALAPHLAAAREALVEALLAVPADAVARRVRGRAWSGGRPEPIAPLATAAFAAALSPGDLVRRRTGLPLRIVERDGPVVLELPDRTLTLPAATLVALRAVVGPGCHRVGSVPGMDQDDQVVLVRRLLREGVLVPATR
jgi:lysine-specific demethylase/histidyl-hydroxylase NO66